MLHHFKRFVLSFEVGSRKPEPGIYRDLIRQTGLPPQQCLFVDDKLPLVTAARAQGLQSWQFTSPAGFVRVLQQRGILSP